MTTTATYQGMENGEKPTSRVLAPPGGASNFAIGGYGGDEPADTPAKTQADEAAPESEEPANALTESPNIENAEQSNPAPETEESVPSEPPSTTENADPAPIDETNVPIETTEIAEPSDPAPPSEEPTQSEPPSTTENAEPQPADEIVNAPSESTKAEIAEPSNPAPEEPATESPSTENPPPTENNVPAVNGTPEKSPKQSPAKSPPKSPKSPKVKSPTQKSPAKSPTTKSPPKSPRAKAPSPTPKKTSTEPKTPREKASTPRTPRIKTPTPRSQTPRSGSDTPRKNESGRGEKPDMVFGPLVIERPGSGKRHFKQRVVDTKNNLFGETEGTQGTKPGSNRRNVSTLYMGGDVATPVDDSKPTRRQYNYHDSNSFSAVYGRPGEDPKPEITHESRKKPGKQEDGISPITGQYAGGSVSSTTQSDAPRSRKPERLRPGELPAAGVKAYAEEPHGKRSIPPGGPSGGMF